MIFQLRQGPIARSCTMTNRSVKYVGLAHRSASGLCVECRGEGLDPDNEYCKTCDGHGVIEI